MAAIQINGGSEKQNAWASKIASDWLAVLDAEINNIELRQDQSLAWYADNLQASRNSLMSGFAKVTAKQVIDMHTAKISPVRSLIEKARVK
jgi:hypothetical protein